MDQTTLKAWTTLGLGTLISACGAADTAPVPSEAPAQISSAPDAAPDVPSLDDAAESPMDVHAPLAGGGEGEGGVDISRAAYDPVVFRSALAIAEAHVIAGRDAYAAGYADAAGEMFAHPVSEVLAEMEEPFAVNGVEDFSDAFLEASDAAYSGESVEAVSTRASGIIATLREVAEQAPAGVMTEGQVAVRVVADQIDRAADMYAIAQASADYEPYLDGYGFYLAARDLHAASLSDIEATAPASSQALATALDLLSTAYPSVARPETLDQAAGPLKAAASEVLLGL